MNTEQQAAGPVEPDQVLDLDLASIGVRLVDDDGRLAIVLYDEGGVAYLTVRANPDAESVLRRLRVALERLEPEVKRRTIGYRPVLGPTSTPVGTPWSHVPLTGPTPWPPKLSEP